MDSTSFAGCKVPDLLAHLVCRGAQTFCDSGRAMRGKGSPFLYDFYESELDEHNEEETVSFHKHPNTSDGHNPK